MAVQHVWTYKSHVTEEKSFIQITVTLVLVFLLYRLAERMEED